MDCYGADSGGPCTVEYIKMRYIKMHFGCGLKNLRFKMHFLLLKNIYKSALE